MKRALMLVLLSARAAAADQAPAACLEIDLARDALDESERAVAIAELQRAFEQHGLQVVAAPCAAPYRIAHLRLGPSVTVYLDGPRGSRQVTGEAFQLPALYAQLARAVLAPPPAPPAPAPAPYAVAPPAPIVSVALDPVPTRPAGIWYLALGAALFPTARSEPGTGYTAGYRYEDGRFGVDLSMSGATIKSEQSETGGAFALEVGGLYFPGTKASHSFYVGAGLSLAYLAIARPEVTYEKGGLRGELTAGYELLRDARHVRLFAQLDVSLPMFTMTPRDPEDAAAGVLYAPSLMLSFGAGFGN